MKFMLIQCLVDMPKSHFLISLARAGLKNYVNSVSQSFFKSLQCIKSSQQFNKFKIEGMSNKSRLNWSSEEDKLLKYLRDDEKIEKWNEVANRLKIISSHPRTSKQCRERYISTAKFCESQDQIKSWSQNQQSLIFKLYLNHGPKWTFFTQFFQSRSENSIKNRFYNFIRKILRKMNQLNENRYPYNKKSLKIQSLLVILELSKKIQTESQSLIGQKANPQMELLLIRNEILKFSLTLDQIQSCSVLDLVDRIHKTNCYLRHLGIFKAKNKKTWKLDRKRLLYILGMQGCPQVYKEHKFDEDVFTTKNFHSPVSSPALSQESSIKNIPDNVFEELDLDASYQFNNWTDDFNRKMFDILGEDILPSFNFDCFN